MARVSHFVWKEVVLQPFYWLVRIYILSRLSVQTVLLFWDVFFWGGFMLPPYNQRAMCLINPHFSVDYNLSRNKIQVAFYIEKASNYDLFLMYNMSHFQ